MLRFAAGPFAPNEPNSSRYVVHGQVKVTTPNGCGRPGTSAQVRHDSSAPGDAADNRDRAGLWCFQSSWHSPSRSKAKKSIQPDKHVCSFWGNQPGPVAQGVTARVEVVSLSI
jgi:hypothetical protein